jgi:hypothetical protein
MIDIHPPQHAAMTRRDFFIHLGIVVLGILIAIGLEQTVEFLHKHHQAVYAEQALRDESLQNRALVQRDLPSIAHAQQLIRANMRALDRAASPASAPFHPVAFASATYILTPHDVAWITLRDGDLIPLLPSPLSTTYWELEYDRSIVQEAASVIVERRQDVEGLLHLHDDPSTLSADEREKLLLAFSGLDQALDNMRTGLLIYNHANEAALAGQSFDPDGVFDGAGVR